MNNKKDLETFDLKMKDRFLQLTDLLRLRIKLKPGFEALKITFIYIAIGILWIMLSDKLLDWIIQDDAVYKKIQLFKGWFYVLVTGVIFFLIIRNALRLFKEAVDKAIEEYEELSATNEELLAMDEELKQQYDELENHRNALYISEQRYELAVEGANDGIWDWDIQTDTYFLSKSWKKSFGYNENELEDNLETWKTLFHPEDGHKAYNAVNKYMATPTDEIYENLYRIRCKNGEYRWVLSHGKGVWDEEGNPLRIAGSHTDITDNLEMKQLLSLEKELSDSIIRNAPLIIIVFDKNGIITQWNPYAEQLLGVTKEEAIGQYGSKVFQSKMPFVTVNDKFDQLLEGSLYDEMDILCGNGHMVTILWNNIFIRNQESHIQEIVAIGLNITERRIMEDRLQTMAYYDALTGLPNRIKLEEDVKQRIALVKANQQKLVFIYLDIDNFKHINDTVGHTAGDGLIRHIAKCLSANIKEPNIVARLGGDEFAIILMEWSDNNDIHETMHPVLTSLRQPWTHDNKEFYISVSLGAAIYPEHGNNFSTLMRNADTAMFHTKESGKDGLSVFRQDMLDKTLSYIQMSSELRTAIQNNEFVLYYQPKIDLFSETLIGAEALIRWKHPEKGIVYPMSFIPFAEETGHINAIGDWVLETAIKQKKVWNEQGHPNINISINLSSHMVKQTNLVHRVQRILSEYDVKSGELELEITETAFMKELDKAMEVLMQLKSMGIIISLDDFGTGYSSLTYLQKLPIDILKIDKEFIRNINSKKDKVFIIEAIVNLAHSLGLKVVAEGVEEKEQLAYLKEIGCDIAQGYYYSKPIPAEDFEQRFLCRNLDKV